MLHCKQRVSISVQGATLCARLFGEIDHHSAAAMRRELDGSIAQHRPSVLRMDLTGIDFMDSSGLGLLMGRYDRMSRMGGELIVCDPTPSVLRMIRLAGLDRILKIEATKQRKG